MPIGDYLVGGRGGRIGAHQKYYPSDWSIRECRKRLTVHLI